MGQFTLMLSLPMLVALAVVAAGQAPPPYREPDGHPAPSNVPGQAFPRILSDLRVTFRVTAPNAREVLVEPFDSSGLGSREFPMARGADGVWSVTTSPVRPGFHYYELVVDGYHCADRNSETFYGWFRQISGLEVPDPMLDFYEARKAPHGNVRAVYYHSKVTGSLRRAFVYTPPGYDGTRGRYPTLYLQHDEGESESGWSNQGRANFILDNLISEGRAVPMLVVMDNGYANLADGVAAAPRNVKLPRSWRSVSAFERVLLEDLIPTIDRDFRTVADADHRALAGHFMGGTQALDIGLQHMDRFRWLGCFSGMHRPFDSAFGVLANPGEANRKIRLLWLGNGSGDGTLRDGESAHMLLEHRGVRHVWFTCPGSHEWQVWRKHLNAFAPLLFRARPGSLAGSDRN